MPLPESNEHVFEHKVGGGVVTAIFGLPFALSGLAVMVMPLFGDSNDTSFGFTIPFGSIFFLVGAAFMFGRFRIRIDKQKEEITSQWSLILPLRTKRQSLKGAKEIRISHEIRRSKNSSYSVYPVRLATLVGKPINFETARSPQDARKFAEKLSKFLHLPLTDSSQGTSVTRQADELDLNLKQRLQAGRLETNIPDTPSRLVCKIDFDGSRLKVEIPPPGPQLKLIFGIIPVLGFMGFAAFVVLGPILQGKDELPLPVLLFMILFFSIPGSIIISLLGKMFLFRQSLLADSSIVSHSRGWLFRKITTIPCDQVEEILLGTPGNARSELSTSKGKSILIRSDEKCISVSNHLPASEADYILSLLRAVIAS